MKWCAKSPRTRRELLREHRIQIVGLPDRGQQPQALGNAGALGKVT